MKRDVVRSRDLREGQYWDHVLSGPVNAVHRKIVMKGSVFLTYETELGIKRTCRIVTFLQWVRRSAECSDFRKEKP